MSLGGCNLTSLILSLEIISLKNQRLKNIFLNKKHLKIFSWRVQLQVSQVHIVIIPPKNTRKSKKLKHTNWPGSGDMRCLRNFTRMVLEKIEPWDEVMAQASDVMVHAEGQGCEKSCVMVRWFQIVGWRGGWLFFGGKKWGIWIWIEFGLYYI